MAVAKLVLVRATTATDLDKSYDELKAWEKALLDSVQNSSRRYFNVSETQWYTDIWECAPVQYYKGKHPCEKPMQIMENIIQASSQPGDMVLDPFMGGGTTGLAAIENDRRFIDCELNRGYFINAKNGFQSEPVHYAHFKRALKYR